MRQNNFVAGDNLQFITKSDGARVEFPARMIYSKE